MTERTLDAGVSADGVLLKDGVVPKTAYPDALLLDGTRAMTGKFQALDAKFTLPNTNIDMGEITVGGYIYPELRPQSEIGNWVFMRGGVIAYDPVGNYPAIYLYETVGGVPDPTKSAGVVYNRAFYGGLRIETFAGDIIIAPTGKTTIYDCDDLPGIYGKTVAFTHAKFDDIVERATGVGVTIENVLLKDGLVDGRDVGLNCIGGLSDTVVFVDNNANTHTVVIDKGHIQSWTIV